MFLAICAKNDLPTIQGTYSHVISIWDATVGEQAAIEIEQHFPQSKRFVCLFDDIIDGEGVLPSLEILTECLEFARGAESILIHCKAGISRSTAIAYAILCEHAGPGREAECFEKLLTLRPVAYPNRLLVELADDYLGRKGAMVRENKKRRMSRYMNGASDDDL
jgi:predicted protein tyrosine phosphatase